MAQGNEIIDVQKLTHRELLIRLHDKVEVLDGKLDTTIGNTSVQIESLVEKQVQTRVDVAKLETKVKSQSVVFGAISGLVTSITAILIKLFVR